MFSLDGKSALITGASGGIGGAIAQALHSQGAFVAIAPNGEVLALADDSDVRLQNVCGYWKYGMNTWGRELRAAIHSFEKSIAVNNNQAGAHDCLGKVIES